MYCIDRYGIVQARRTFLCNTDVSSEASPKKKRNNHSKERGRGKVLKKNQPVPSRLNIIHTLIMKSCTLSYVQPN